MTSEPLAGRRALVTGAGTGIGRAVALGLARAGASVAIHYHRSEAGAASARSELLEEGREAHIIRADLKSPDETRVMVRAAAEALGGLDILVNNAGLTAPAPFDTTSSDLLERLYRTNVQGTYVATQAALPYLASGTSPSVLITTSVHGVTGFPGFSAYAATKGALIALTRQLAIELAPRGIRINCVGPGIIENDATRAYPGYSAESNRTRVPLGRVGMPEDLVGTVLFLVSDAAAFVTGQVIFVDGGVSARMGLHWPEVEAAALAAANDRPVE